jgi:hypothetical protein
MKWAPDSIEERRFSTENALLNQGARGRYAKSREVMPEQKPSQKL